MSNQDNAESLYDIAIIGMSGRFPKADSVERLWENLCAGVEAVTLFSDEELIKAGVEPSHLLKPNYVKARAVIENPEMFDAAFFGFSPREAEIMDPQNRLFLECAWETLEHAGYVPERYEGLIGVFAGSGTNAYIVRAFMQHESLDGFHILILNDKHYLPTHVSYKLNLKGPSVTVQTACSTSLVATHLACQSLLNRECDIALAGGVSVGVPQITGYFYIDGGVHSADGHCRAFDHAASGTVAGSGVAIVALKRMADALADGDFIHAVIKGSAINNDGSAKVGFTAPSVEGQAAVIQQAIAMAGIDPETVTYVETHGTGTTLGDPIEVAALTQAFRAYTNREQFCAIGSLKTNIGHLDTAAGAAGLIKTVLALKHERLPPSLNFERPNPHIDFESSPFYVNTSLREWRTAGAVPRRAGVSSFGIGGTNAHVIVEQAPFIDRSHRTRDYQLLMLSARSEAALDRTADNLAHHLESQAGINLANVAYTLQVGRRHFKHRRVIVCRDPGEAAAALATKDARQVFDGQSDTGERNVVFMFPGGGAQYVNMARDLYVQEASFRRDIEHCWELLKQHCDYDLRQMLYPDAETLEHAEKMKRTAVALPALFTVEYALAKLLMGWGIRPRAMIGHSLGEYVAACLAGVLSLDEALSLVALRGRLIEQLPKGAMLSLPLSEDAARELIDERLAIAATNTPANSVISGPVSAIDELAVALSEKGIDHRRLLIEAAGHSAMVEPILEPIIELARRMKLRAPEIPYLSNVSGTWITDSEATDPAYWGRHLRQTVRFADGVDELLRLPNPIFLEVGPGHNLSTLVRLHPLGGSAKAILSSVRHPYEQQSDVAFLLASLGKLWLAGVNADWPPLYEAGERRRVPLPTYPFERKRFWIEAVPDDAHMERKHEKKPDIADWFYVPSWKRSALPVGGEQGKPLNEQRWVFYLDDCGVAEQVAERFERAGGEAIFVSKGESFSRIDEHAYAINAENKDDYLRLFADLVALGKAPDSVAHFWGLSQGDESDGPTRLEEELSLSYYSLLFTAQAISECLISRPRRIDAVSNNVHEVIGDEARSAARATTLAACKVIQQEYASLNCRQIDIDLIEIEPHELLSERLITELMTPPDNPAVAYRRGRRWLQSFEPVRIEAEANPAKRLRERGVYLITGGLGGIALEIAEYMARAAQARLVLVNRSPLPPREEWERRLDEDGDSKAARRIKKVRHIESLGAEMMIATADVSDPEQMKSVVAEALSRFGKIDGVIHAAGVPDGGLIQLKTRADSLRILAPKVKGTIVLYDLLKDAPLDFFVLCSALNAHTGGLGQVDYAAANAFLDAFAVSCKHEFPTIAINWDTWQEVGMGVEAALPASLEQYREVTLREKILSEEGVEAFARILRAGLPQVLVSTRDFEAEVENAAALKLEHALEDEAELTSQRPQAAHPRPALGTAYAAPRDHVERSIAELWQTLLGIEAVGINDNFFELGGHSLLAVQILASLRTSFEVELSLRDLFARPTIIEWAAAVTEKQAAIADQAKVGGSHGDEAADDLSPSLDDRSIEAWDKRGAPFMKEMLARARGTYQQDIPRRENDACLVAIQPLGERPPFFCVHALSGSASVFYDLSKWMGNRQPFYAFQSRGLDAQAEPYRRIEAMAAHYIEAMRGVQPSGPYLLGGWSFGSLVAFEMAHQLEAHGDEVALLAFIDMGIPVDASLGRQDTAALLVNMVKSFAGEPLVSLESLHLLAPDEQLIHVWEFLKEHGLIPRGFDLKWFRAYFDVFRANCRAAINYVPRPYPGKATLLRAAENPFSDQEDETRGWNKYVAGGIEVIVTTGNHYTMTREPHVSVLAERLTDCLEAVTAQSTSA